MARVHARMLDAFLASRDGSGVTWKRKWWANGQGGEGRREGRGWAGARQLLQVHTSCRHEPPRPPPPSPPIFAAACCHLSVYPTDSLLASDSAQQNQRGQDKGSRECFRTPYAWLQVVIAQYESAALRALIAFLSKCCMSPSDPPAVRHGGIPRGVRIHPRKSSSPSATALVSLRSRHCVACYTFKQTHLELEGRSRALGILGALAAQ